MAGFRFFSFLESLAVLMLVYAAKRVSPTTLRLNSSRLHGTEGQICKRLGFEVILDVCVDYKWYWCATNYSYKILQDTGQVNGCRCRLASVTRLDFLSDYKHKIHARSS